MNSCTAMKVDLGTQVSSMGSRYRREGAIVRVLSI